MYFNEFDNFYGKNVESLEVPSLRKINDRVFARE